MYYVKDVVGRVLNPHTRLWTRGLAVSGERAKAIVAEFAALGFTAYAIAA